MKNKRKKLFNKKGDEKLEFIMKIILWIIVLAILVVGLYYLLKRLTG